MQSACYQNNVKSCLAILKFTYDLTHVLPEGLSEGNLTSGIHNLETPHRHIVWEINVLITVYKPRSSTSPLVNNLPISVPRLTVPKFDGSPHLWDSFTFRSLSYSQRGFIVSLKVSVFARLHSTHFGLIDSNHHLALNAR